jgi:hypothetical protein
MTNPTITSSGSLNFYSSGNKILQLYNVQSESVRKSAGTIDLPMPTMDSNGKIIMDLMGASREITIDGVATSGDIELFKYAQDIAGLKGTYNTLINGAQGTDLYSYFSLAVSSAINVCVTETNVKYEKGSPNMILYSISMMESDTLI